MKNDKMSILIDKDLHEKFKIYCVINRYKMAGLVEKIIEDKLKENEK